MNSTKRLPEGFRIPAYFHRWNRAHAGAYCKGAGAFAAGLGIDACPYEDKRKPSGRLSGSRAFLAAWRDGWQDARRQDYENERPNCACGNPNPYWAYGKGSNTRREWACHECHQIDPDNHEAAMREAFGPHGQG